MTDSHASPSPLVADPLPASALLHPVFTSPRVRAWMTTRAGGVSAGAWAGLNLREDLGDDAAAVARNRLRLQACVGAPIQRLRQVHGTAVQVVDRAADVPDPTDRPPAWPEADAVMTTLEGIACEIQVADCLPVLLADRGGRAVAAAHAGWRGLAGGVLEATLAALQQRAGVEPAEVEAWLGPCIGPGAFEVGTEVVAAFGATPAAPGPAFRASVAAPDGSPRWHADLAALARERLRRAGVSHLVGNDSSAGWCTHADPSRFFSFRRDRITGRMAAVIMLRGGFGRSSVGG